MLHRAEKIYSELYCLAVVMDRSILSTSVMSWKLAIGLLHQPWFLEVALHSFVPPSTCHHYQLISK